MGFGMRKSIKLGPGVRLNASHRGAGVRIGRGGGVSFNTSGPRSASVGIPGSGIGYTKQWSSRSGRRPARAAAAPVAPPAPPKPGLLAYGYEKAFHKAVNALAAGKTDEAVRLFRESSEKDTKEKALADDFFVGLLSAQRRDDDVAITYLETVVGSDQELPDELMSKYVEEGGISLP